MEIWIKCPNCNSRYIVSEEDLNLEDVEYTCSNCGNTISVEYFGYCPTCKYITGHKPEFTTQQGLVNLGKSLVRGLVDLSYSYNSISALVDRVPFAKHSGRCLFCNSLHIECPECHKLYKINCDWEPTDVLICPSCKCKFRHP